MNNIMNEPKFKIGDKVKIVKPRSYREPLRNCIDEIESVHMYGNIFETEYLLKNCSNLIFESELRKVEEEMKKEFTIKDLRNGDVVLYRNGETAIFIGVNYNCSFVSPDGYNTLVDYNNDFTNNFDSPEYDIMAVRRPKNTSHCQFNAFKYNWGELVYERKEVEEMTLEEICKALGKEIKIVKEKK